MAKKRARKQAKKKRNYASNKKRQEERSRTGTSYLKVPADTQFFKLDGKKRANISIVPYEVGKGNPYAEEGSMFWERTFWIHRSVGPDNKSFVDPMKTAGKKCPICEEYAKIEDKQSDEAKSLRPKERQLFNVFDHDEPEKGVQLWDVSNYLFGQILEAQIENFDDDDPEASFFHAEDGMSIRCKVEEDSFQGNKFSKITAVAFKAREDLDDEIVDAALCLDDLLVIPSYKELQDAFTGLVDTEDEDEDDAEEAKDWDEDEDESEDVEEEEEETEDEDDVEEEEEDEDEWDDAEEAEEEDDWEDDWEDEEEEEEKPAPKKNSSRRKRS